MEDHDPVRSNNQLLSAKLYVLEVTVLKELSSAIVNVALTCCAFDAVPKSLKAVMEGDELLAEKVKSMFWVVPGFAGSLAEVL